MPEEKPKFNNEPIAAIIKDGVVLHEDYAPVKGCTMTDLTYGEICIKCNVCGRFEDQGQPTERQVRGQLCPSTLGPESNEEGWGFADDCETVHYFERHSGVSVCGWIGKPDDLWDDATACSYWLCDFCPKCIDTIKKEYDTWKARQGGVQ
ncbi:MAG: hypothetical protein ACXABF_13870 [Candidatus Thorarchaeota archaeon]|jgi:hypothetical protein